MKCVLQWGPDFRDIHGLILIAFITGNSSLEPLIEGLCAQILVNLRWRVFRPESNQGPYGLLTFLSAALSTTELWWQMNHRKSFRKILRKESAPQWLGHQQ